jgi:type-F conjugative transfer system pilin assembly protein TrbC
MHSERAYGAQKEVFVSAPDRCSKLERVEDDKVFLRSGSSKCEPGQGKLSVTVDSKVNRLSVYVDGKLWREQPAISIDVGAIRDATEKAMGQKLAMPKNYHMEKGRLKAEELSEYFNSKAYQDKVKAESERLRTEVFGDQLKGFRPQGEGTRGGRLSSDERVYLFVSSSVPLETLRNYAADMDKLGDPNISMVMRGFVNGMKYMKPTLDFLTKVILEDPGCDVKESKCAAHDINFMIDPLLFRMYEIEVVPAIVYARNVSVADTAMSEGAEGNAKVGDYYVLYGDVSLEYALELFHSETRSKSMERLLKAIRKGFY